MKSAFEGRNPSNILFKYQIEHLKMFDFAVLFKFELFFKNGFKVRTWKKNFSLNFCHFARYKSNFSVHIPILFISLSFNKIGKITNLTNFWLKIMVFFKWPEIRKYWSDRTEPKYGKRQEHFKFVFSWVKCQNSSFIARYSRELTYGTWLVTPYTFER